MATGGKPDSGHMNGGATSARLDALEKELSDLKGQQRSTDTKIDERTKTQWPVILGAGGLILTAAVYILNQNAADLSELKAFVNANMVPLETHKAIAEREAALRSVQDERISQIRAEIELVKAQNANVYNAGDVIKRLEREIDDLEARLRVTGAQ